MILDHFQHTRAAKTLERLGRKVLVAELCVRCWELVAAAALSQLMSALLFGIKPIDPLTYIAVAITLLAATAMASYSPARRITTAPDRSRFSQWAATSALFRYRNNCNFTKALQKLDRSIYSMTFPHVI